MSASISFAALARQAETDIKPQLSQHSLLSLEDRDLGPWLRHKESFYGIKRFGAGSEEGSLVSFGGNEH